MYLLKELETKTEDKTKFDLDMTNNLFYYWLKSSDGTARFLGGQAWIDENGINVKGDGVGDVEGLRFFDDLGAQVGKLAITNANDIYLEADNDLFIKSLDFLQVWGDTLEIKSQNDITLTALDDIDVAAGGVLDVHSARLVIPTVTSNPGSPRSGEMWLRTDL